MPVDDKVKQLVLLLISYEMDEPHVDYPEVLKEKFEHYPEITWEKFEEEFLSLEHDCLKPGNHGCPRCFADQLTHKAQWIIERIDSDGIEDTTTL